MAEGNYVLIVDRWTNPENGDAYRKGDDLPDLDDRQAKRMLDANAIVESGTVLADVSKGNLDQRVVSGVGNMTADGLETMGQTYLRLAEERRTLEQGVSDHSRAAFTHAKSTATGLDQGTDASGNRLRSPTSEIDAFEKAEVQEGASIASPPVPTEQSTEAGDELKATEDAKKEARASGVDLGEVSGTGSGGQVTVEDVRQHASEQPEE